MNTINLDQFIPMVRANCSLKGSVGADGIAMFGNAEIGGLEYKFILRDETPRALSIEEATDACRSIYEQSGVEKISVSRQLGTFRCDMATSIKLKTDQLPWTASLASLATSTATIQKADLIVDDGAFSFNQIESFEDELKEINLGANLADAIDAAALINSPVSESFVQVM